MCGVVGLLMRDRSLEPHLGSMLVPMIEALDERGPDSSGIAVYADHDGNRRLSGGADSESRSAATSRSTGMVCRPPVSEVRSRR